MSQVPLRRLFTIKVSEIHTQYYQRRPREQYHSYPRVNNNKGTDSHYKLSILLYIVTEDRQIRYLEHTSRLSLTFRIYYSYFLCSGTKVLECMYVVIWFCFMLMYVLRVLYDSC